MRSLVSLLCLAALLGGCGAPANRTSQATSQPPAGEALPAPFSGENAGQTATFTLAGGDYIVDWTATDTSSSGVGCYFAPALKEDGGAGYESLPDAEPEGGGTKSGSANLHDVAGGRWYFDIITHCAWTLAIKKG